MLVSPLARQESSEIYFEEGIIGVPRARRFQLLERPGSEVRMLSCLDIDGFVLPVIDPRLADDRYEPKLSPRFARALNVDEGDPLLVLVVATLDDGSALANLRAPLVINTAKRLGAQVILDDRSIPLQAPVRSET